MPGVRQGQLINITLYAFTIVFVGSGAFDWGEQRRAFQTWWFKLEHIEERKKYATGFCVDG